MHVEGYSSINDNTTMCLWVGFWLRDSLAHHKWALTIHCMNEVERRKLSFLINVLLWSRLMVSFEFTYFLVSSWLASSDNLVMQDQEKILYYFFLLQDSVTLVCSVGPYMGTCWWALINKILSSKLFQLLAVVFLLNLLGVCKSPLEECFV